MTVNRRVGEFTHEQNAIYGILREKELQNLQRGRRQIYGESMKVSVHEHGGVVNDCCRLRMQLRLVWMF